MEVPEGDAATVSWEDAGADWEGLERVLSEHALADMASKAQMLRSLSSFLSSVATTMSFSTDHHSVSAWVGAAQVGLGHYEVFQLHELVVRELKDQTCFLSEPSWTSNTQMDESADVDYSRILNLEIVSQTLQCCIRILPLVDCFDKDASLTTTKMLDGILQQLCYPIKLFDVLGLAAPDGMHSGNSCQTAQGNDGGTCCEMTEPYAFKQFSDSASLQYTPDEACMANLCAVDSRHRIELIFAILEVYMDELLLHPDLIIRLLNSREDRTSSLAQDQIVCDIKHFEASLQAAFVHVLLSFHSLPIPLALHRARSKALPVCNLSLPTGLILLEKFSGEGIPPFYLAHIVRLLAKILNDATPLDFGQVDELTRTSQILSKNCLAGGVDWSYCSKERLPNCDLKDARLYTKVLHSETTLNFASSILEHAILMYRRFSLPSDTFPDNTCSTQYWKLQGSLLTLYLSKYTPLFDIFSERFKLNTDSHSLDTGIEQQNLYMDDCHCCASEILNFQGVHLKDGSGFLGDNGGEFQYCGVDASIHAKRRMGVLFKNADTDNVSGMVAALLQLMSCALDCIGREVCKLTWLPHVFCDQFISGQSMLASMSSEADLNKILHCVGLYLSLCIPLATSPCLKCVNPACGRATDDRHGTEPIACELEPLNDIVGQAIIFFTNILRGEVQKRAADRVLEEYFHLIESLVALLLALDERNSSRHLTPETGLGSNCMLSANICRTSLGAADYKQCARFYPHGDDAQQLPQESNTFRFLEEMVLVFQAMLEDLAGQQRSMPEFLLYFVFKQVSKRDGLRIVTTAFSSFFDSDLDVQQNMFHNTEVFWSGGLITQILHLALSEPARSSSLSTYIVYMVDILQDLLPISAALSLSEITEPISWYENIAHSLTMASQLAVSEHRLFVRNGSEHSRSLISKLDEGIDRVLKEGAAAAHWLSDLSKTMSETEWYNLTGGRDATGAGTIGGHNLCGESSNNAGNFAKCNTFLEQVDLLRTAVEDLASMESSIGSELASLLEKGRSFSMALLNLLATKKLPGSHWNLYLSPHNQHHCFDPELQRHPWFESTDPDAGCNCISAQHEDVEWNMDLRVDLGTSMEPMKCKGSNIRKPASDSSTTADKLFKSDKVSSGEFYLEQGSDLLDEQQEQLQDCTEFLEDEIILSAEIPVSNSTFTPEMRHTRSVTSMNMLKLAAKPNGMCSEKTPPTPNDRKTLTTSAIIKRLLRNRSPVKKKSASSSQDCDKRPAGDGELIHGVETISGQSCVHTEFMIDASTEGDIPTPSFTNLYVESLSGQDPKDNFDDLKDFIVPKKGRDYSAWMKRRQKVRRRLYNKTFFRRLRDKKELLLLLDM